MSLLKRLLSRTPQSTDFKFYRSKATQEAQKRGIKSSVYGRLFDEFCKNGYSPQETFAILEEWLKALKLEDI